MEGKTLSPGRAMLVPAGFVAGLLALAFLLRSSTTVAWSIVAAAGFLAAWSGVLLLRAAPGREFTLRLALRKPHYVQMIAQGLLFTWWAFHVPGIRAFPPLVLAQLLFAYGFSTLLAWTRRGWTELGFGPVPITLSINFFLLFRPEFFYWQFGIVALGYLAKDFIRWERGGRSQHIFNPSSFPLAVFSLFLILTGTTNATLGLEIATTLFNPPHIYLVIFLVSLPGQILFGVATMTISAVATTVVFGLAYFWATGTYYFQDAYIPIAVFLGMHLLFTDPSTSPRTERGRVVFGVLYASATITAAGLLSTLGLPTFYDKLLPIPLINLSVRWIDRLFAEGALKGIEVKALWNPLSSAQRRFATTGAWVTVFAALALTGSVGDEHEGQWVPFWNEACVAGSERACDYLATIEQNFCEDGSGWSCNELGILLAERHGDLDRAAIAMRRGCELEFPEACANLSRLGTTTSLVHGDLRPPDLPILVRGSKGPVVERDLGVLYGRACEIGFPACGRQFAGE